MVPPDVSRVKLSQLSAKHLKPLEELEEGRPGALLIVDPPPHARSSRLIDKFQYEARSCVVVDDFGPNVAWELRRFIKLIC